MAQRCDEENGARHVIGDPTEGALLVVAAKAAHTIETLDSAYHFLGEVPFDPERKMMTIVRRTPDGPSRMSKARRMCCCGTARIGWRWMARPNP